LSSSSEADPARRNDEMERLVSQAREQEAECGGLLLARLGLVAKKCQDRGEIRRNVSR